MSGNEDTGLLGRILLRSQLDGILLALIAVVLLLGLFVLYSASGESTSAVISQSKRIALGLVFLVLVARLNPDTFRAFAPWLYSAGLVLLVLVLLLGDTAKGAQRWLDLGVIRFQPSELMKVAVPMMLASYLHARSLPPDWKSIGVCTALVVVPVMLIMRQPDLGTALMIGIAGGFVLYIGGLRWRVLISLAIAAAAAAPAFWYQMHDYQRERVLTFLNPARDPGGAGYHITQSKVAIGSGGLFGKGWLSGTQAQLDFLPESATDFIFAVYAEEVGLLGVLVLLALYLSIVGRGLFISVRGQDTFQRLLAGGLSLVFFFYVFVNIGMVIGLLPVVGVPLPLISWGGTSMVSLLASLGVLMSIHTHRRLLSS